jgi:hypothetical protein
MEVRERRDAFRDHAEGEGDRAALTEGVDAEARQVDCLVGEVEVPGVVEELEACGGRQPDRVERLLEVDGGQRRMILQRCQRPVPAKVRRLVLLQVEVGRAELDGTPQQGVEVHETLVGTGVEPLERGYTARSRGCARVAKGNGL